MYNIKYIGDPILRKKAEDIKVFDEKFRGFLEEMSEVMYTKDGIGLAAPQIGISKKVVVIDISELEDQEELRIFINPKILETSGSSVVEEGCLSIPGVREEVTRPELIKLSYKDETGAELEHEFEGWLARVLQHEIDHLNGVLFVDHLSPIKKQLLVNKKAIPEIY